MNSIAAFQMVKAIDEERHAAAERRRQSKIRHAATAETDAKFVGGQSWRAILRFPRFTAAPSKS
jgi:hypothetical protein